MEIGVLINYTPSTDIDSEMKKIKKLDLQTCQLCVWDPKIYSEENAHAVKSAAATEGIRISTLWAGWSGPSVWDFYSGPLTLGLVPSAYRFTRLNELKRGADFAASLGVKYVATHVGFLPENPNDPEYKGVIAALTDLALYLKERDLDFLFETGQETPTTLTRAIEDIGTGNVGINFDTANLLLYGKGRSLDAAHIFGKYVRDLHCKDGDFPTNGHHLGNEMPLGQGKAQIAEVIRYLTSIGYAGPLTIEREISGEQQIRDITLARDLLRSFTTGI